MNSPNSYRPVIKDISTTLLAEGKTVRIRAHGYSMYPSIRPGTVLIIDPLRNRKDPEPGEIIVLKRENGLVVHRLLKIEIHGGKRWYTARGDSNAFADEPVTIDGIAGVVVRSETTAECRVPADLKINRNPSFVSNRLKVIAILVLRNSRVLTPFRKFFRWLSGLVK
jgi:signal peptidase I